MAKPVCPHCQRKMANTTTKAGVPFYSCTKKGCPGSLKYYLENGIRA